MYTYEPEAVVGCTPYLELVVEDLTDHHIHQGTCLHCGDKIGAQGGVEWRGLSGGRILTAAGQPGNDSMPIKDGGSRVSSSANLKRYILMDNHDAGVTYGWDEDADILFVELMGRRSHCGSINAEKTKLLDHDQDGNPTGIDFLYCSEGITLEDVPEPLHEHVRAAAKVLGISLDETQ